MKKAIIIGEKNSPQTVSELELLLETLQIEAVYTMRLNLRKINPA